MVAAPYHGERGDTVVSAPLQHLAPHKAICCPWLLCVEEHLGEMLGFRSLPEMNYILQPYQNDCFGC